MIQQKLLLAPRQSANLNRLFTALHRLENIQKFRDQLDCSHCPAIHILGQAGEELELGVSTRGSLSYIPDTGNTKNRGEAIQIFPFCHAFAAYVKLLQDDVDRAADFQPACLGKQATSTIHY